MAILEGPMVEFKQIVVEDIKKEIIAFANSDKTFLQGSSSVPASESAIRFIIRVN